MDNMDKKIREAFSKKRLFEDIDLGQSKSLEEFFENNDVEDYGWDETLEEALYEAGEEMQGDQLKAFKVGDILMTTSFRSHGREYALPHRILVITARKLSGDVMEYEGYLLSSKINKSNKYSKYQNNIYIKNYSSILAKGAPADKEAFIRVDDLVKFDSRDLSARGTWKGAINDEFREFLYQCVKNYRSGNSNAEMYWEK